MRIKMYILPRFYIDSCPFSGTYYVGHTRCQLWVERICVDRLQFVNSVLYISVSLSYNIMTFFYIVCFSIALGTVFFLCSHLIQLFVLFAANVIKFSFLYCLCGSWTWAGLTGQWALTFCLF